MSKGDARQLELPIMNHRHLDGLTKPPPYTGGGAVVLFDIDGTAREYSGDVPLVLIDALQGLEKQGVRTILASGKHFDHLVALADAIGITPIAFCAEGGGHTVSALPGYEADVIAADESVVAKVWGHFRSCRQCYTFERATPRALEERRKVSMVTVYWKDETTAREKCAATVLPHLRDEVLGREPVMMLHPDGAVDILSTRRATKGGIVLWLRDEFKTPHQTILAIGDGTNDIPMLERTAVTHRGCPANASAEVLALMRERGGYVAQDRCGKGMLEVLNHFIGEGVLPEYREAK